MEQQLQRERRSSCDSSGKDSHMQLGTSEDEEAGQSNDQQDVSSASVSQSYTWTRLLSSRRVTANELLNQQDNDFSNKVTTTT